MTARELNAEVGFYPHFMDFQPERLKAVFASIYARNFAHDHNGWIRWLASVRAATAEQAAQQ